MKKMFLIVFAIAFSFSGCEKDDICDANTSTTPRLIIEFYDALNPTVLKEVTDLKVTGVDESSELGIFNGESKIKLPLKTIEDFTKYAFVLNSTDTAIDNEDNLQFDYTRTNVFVSRACGFKSIFTLDPITPFTLSDAGTPDGFWIQDITIETSNIETENETHIKIYF